MTTISWRIREWIMSDEVLAWLGERGRKTLPLSIHFSSSLGREMDGKKSWTIHTQLSRVEEKDFLFTFHLHSFPGFIVGLAREQGGGRKRKKLNESYRNEWKREKSFSSEAAKQSKQDYDGKMFDSFNWYGGWGYLRIFYKINSLSHSLSPAIHRCGWGLALSLLFIQHFTFYLFIHLEALLLLLYSKCVIFVNR